MKKTITLSAVLFLMFAVFANAQKLPNVQEKSVRAPATIKIDGKRPEWDNQIQAINKATSILYTISNDDDKLYLAVLAADEDIANKIINAGITFTINGSGKAYDEGGMAITFPFLYKDDHRPNLPLLDYNKEIAVWNKQLTDKTKDIRVAGIKGVKDTISIYNMEGIKVAALFGDDAVFTWELAIPLKYLGLSVNDLKPFVYNIKLNGTPNYFSSHAENQMNALQHIKSYLRGGQSVRGLRHEGDNFIVYGGGESLVNSLINPTYFSGEYTLAK